MQPRSLSYLAWRACTDASGGVEVKRLAVQVIVSHVSSLSKPLHDEAVDALLDAYEDASQVARIDAVLALPRLCAASRSVSVVSRVADVLVQLLQSPDERELNMVRQALWAVACVDGARTQPAG